MPTLTSNPRWYHLTPERFFVGLLVVQVVLLLSDQFQWFALNEKKGWTVLIALGVVGFAVLVMLVWGLVCLCFRRRFQFGFRSLLVFVVVVSIPFGWFAWEMQRARRQEEAVEAIVKAGGEVFYNYQSEAADWNLIPITEPTTPRWLRELLGDDFFNEVTVVACDDTRLDDNDAGYLKELANVERLCLTGTQITDSGLAHLEGLTKLELLSLDRTQISDSGLAHLEGLTKLELLWLDGTQISDSGLAHLEGLTKLVLLSLEGTQISDSGLAHLEGLTKLKRLYLGGTQVTDEGVEELQQALPNCQIEH